MKKQIVKYICALSLVTAPNFAFSATGTETTGGGSSVKDSSDKAADQNKQGQMMSMLTAGLLAAQSAQHFAKCPKNPGQCALGALKAAMAMMSMMQGAAHAKTAAGANVSSLLTDGTEYKPVSDQLDIDNPNNPLLADNDFKALKSNLSKLENCVSGSCVNVKKGTITTQDGKSYKLSDFNSPESMAAAGIPSGAIAGLSDYNAQLSKMAQDKLDKLKLGAMTAAGGFDEGGGSGGSGMSASAAAEEASGGGGVAAAPIDREPTNLAGMQKNYNGEPIGVAADSIFLMMNRRYKVKESQDSFFTDAELALKK